LYESANLVLANAGKEGATESVNLLAAAFFLIFAYMHHQTERMYFTSSAHETFARRLKAKGIGFRDVSNLSREKFGLWDDRFAEPDREQQRALKEIQSLK
jgi:poly-gamma-glutamate capsule biosynthesis protein CapA/YwtB (metallophosphatase superfamily)